MSSSPAAFCGPVPRVCSSSSAGPDVPSKRVKGARSGLVTGSLATRRLSLCVATLASARSASGRRSGSDRPLLATSVGQPGHPGAVDPHESNVGPEGALPAVRVGRLLLFDQPRDLMRDPVRSVPSVHCRLSPCEVASGSWPNPLCARVRHRRGGRRAAGRHPAAARGLPQFRPPCGFRSARFAPTAGRSWQLLPGSARQPEIRVPGCRCGAAYPDRASPSPRCPHRSARLPFRCWRRQRRARRR